MTDLPPLSFLFTAGFTGGVLGGEVIDEVLERKGLLLSCFAKLCLSL